MGSPITRTASVTSGMYHPGLIHSRTDSVYLQSVHRELRAGQVGGTAWESSHRALWQPLCRVEGTETWQSLVLASSWTVES